MAKLAKLIEEALTKKQGAAMAGAAAVGAGLGKLRKDIQDTKVDVIGRRALLGLPTDDSTATKQATAELARKYASKAEHMTQGVKRFIKHNESPLAGAALAAGALGAGLAAKKFLNRKKK